MASTSGTKDNKRLSRFLQRGMQHAIDSELVPSSIAPITPILRVANKIEEENPRVAYLCRVHAFDKAHEMDPTSTGRGVSQFKTYLLLKLKEEGDEVILDKLSNKDRKELLLYYQKFYEKNIRDGQHTKKLEEMAKNFQIATVLYELLKTVVGPGKLGDKIKEYAEDVEKRREQYEHYNILPLNAPAVKPTILELAEIKAAIHALRNVDNLPDPVPQIHSTRYDPDGRSLVMPTESVKSFNDVLDWLSIIFGFQKGNVANQREHLILLLANMDIKNKSVKDYTDQPGPATKTVVDLRDKIFENYSSWCDYLPCKSNLKFPQGSESSDKQQQLTLIYIGLYLLIWGEASNMAYEVYGILYSNAEAVTGGRYQAVVHDEEYFLREVITPIYKVLKEAAGTNKGGKASHSGWTNYDDLNEYFWSDRCLKLGNWPNLKADYFRNSDPVVERTDQAAAGREMTKTNFVEVRSFWHLYRIFDRMWIFFILAFQAMVIVAWSPSRSLAAVFDKDVFKNVLSVFITYAFLNLLQATLDIFLGWNAWKSLKLNQKLRYLLKFAVAAVWAVVLPIGYSSSVQNPVGIVKFFSNWAGDWRNQSFYNYAIALYLIPNVLAALMFFLPHLRRDMERSNWRIFTLLMWWTQPKIFVGRGMHEDMFSLLKYTLFWIMLLISKLVFSYYMEYCDYKFRDWAFSPNVGPTKLIMEIPFDNYYQQPELFPNATHNIGVVIALWAPIVLVYFMDTQIWYAIFTTLVGGIYGACRHLGEIRTREMLWSRFEAVPSAFSRCLIPPENEDAKRKDLNPSEVEVLLERKNIANFSQVWNEFIYSMRMEDVISDRDRDLLLVPYSSSGTSVVQWPPCLLASKIPTALDMAKYFKDKENDDELLEKIKSDNYMHSAVKECYETLKFIISQLLGDEIDKEILREICSKVDQTIEEKKFLHHFKISELPRLSEKLEKFLKLLDIHRSKKEDEDSEDESESQIINALQDIMKIIIKDIIIKDGHKILERYHSGLNVKKEQMLEKLNIKGARDDKSFREKVVRLLLLLTFNDSAINVPPNLDARRRITFFANSLFMKMPIAPKVRNMLSFSVLTPYFNEEVLYSEEDIEKENEDGISILFYLQKIYPDEWTNFQERIKDIKDPKHADADADAEKEKEAIRQWVSYRGQTLSRTVRGMMYYREALKLQSFLEPPDDAIFSGYRNMDLKSDENAQALADLKFTYVVSCQVYGDQKKSDNPRERSCYNNILNLMLKYPSLRVAYIDEREKMVNGESKKFYFSVLVKGGDKLDEEIYRIKLPGPVKIGEGKPENQNHAIIFTRGEALQTIDMNQDNYFEEAFKMRNALDEFTKEKEFTKKDCCRQRIPTILGVREHIFTGGVSSLAWFMSNQETSFVTIGQRILANPLRVRFHYGHPDIFDRIFHITRGGISKASKTVNLSEDIFAGFNSTLRGGFITHSEYIQVGKGRDVGMNQISFFEAKVANGNGEQTLCRDVYRLGRRFDFYRMLSFYFSTVGFYFSSMLTVLTVYAFLYGRLYIIMSELGREIFERPIIYQSLLEESLATQSIYQLGLLLMLPMLMEFYLEKGFRTALGDFIIMQLELATVFFTFHLGTKVHYFGRTILHGGSKYRATGRGFVVFHSKFSENYMLYSRSHFVKGLELFILLVTYEVYGQSYPSSILRWFITFSMWFLVASWLFAPFVFNPSGFNWEKTVEDWKDWNRWISNRDGIGIPPEKNWESWWEEEQEHLKYTNWRGRVLEIILALRFFIFQYKVVCNLDISQQTNSCLMVYVLSWPLMGVALVVLKMLSKIREMGADIQLMFRFLKALILLAFMSVGTILFVYGGLTISDFFAAILAFMPAGWALILIGQTCRGWFPKKMRQTCEGRLKGVELCESIKELTRAYDYIMGLLLFIPIAILSWFPFVSDFQTRLHFNQAFSKGLQMTMILAGTKDKTKTS